MPDIRSIESQRSEFRPWGSPDLGTSAPLIHKGTQIASRLMQKGSRNAVTATGTVLHFARTFDAPGTPIAFLNVRVATGTIHSALMKNINRSGGTVRLVAAGTKVVDFLAWMP